jgi:hypothetical protein
VIGRFFLGLVKGLVIGAALGAAFHFELGITEAGGLLGYLLAMGTGSTAGILVGRPPWRQDAWLESVLKSVAGMALGAGLFFAANRWGFWRLPFTAFGVASGAPFFTVPLVFLPIVGAAFGAIVELDHTRDDAAVAR